MYVLPRFLLLASIVLMPFCGQAQVLAEPFEFELPNSIPDTFLLDFNDVYEHIHHSAPDRFQEKYPRMITQYADNQAYAISNLLSRAYAYPEWTELESYLSQILQKVTPEEMKGEPFLRAYPCREGGANAGMTAAGVMMVNVGLLPMVNDEASIAAILAHELAHYYLQHNIKGYVANETVFSHNTFGLFGNPYKKKLTHSVVTEMEADSLGLLWLLESGYDIRAAQSNYRMLERSQVNELRRDAWRTELKARTHPTSRQRLEAIDRFYKQHSEAAKGANFLVSEQQFKKLQRDCRYETLRLRHDRYSTRQLIEAAFRFHIMEPNDPTFIYYLMEGLRMDAFTDSVRWQEGFMIGPYFEKEVNPGTGYKPRYNKSLFETFELEIMQMSPQDIRKVQARFYWEGAPKFVTNEQAFTFFGLVGEQLGCTECYLSRALQAAPESAERAKQIDNYLTAGNARYADFAQALANNTVLKQLPSKRLMLLQRFSTGVKQGKDRVSVRVENGGEQGIDTILMRLKTRYSDRSIHYLPEVQATHLPDFLMFSKMAWLGRNSRWSGFANRNLYEFDPRFFDLMKRYGTNEVEFLQVYFTEYRKKERTVEAYNEARSQSIDDLLGKARTTRYMATGIATVRETNKGMRYSAYGSGEERIPVNARAIGTLFHQTEKILERKERYR